MFLWFMPFAYVTFMEQEIALSGQSVGGAAYLMLAGYAAYTILSWLGLHIPSIIAAGASLAVGFLFLWQAGSTAAWGLYSAVVVAGLGVLLSYRNLTAVEQTHDGRQAGSSARFLFVVAVLLFVASMVSSVGTGFLYFCTIVAATAGWAVGAGVIGGTNHKVAPQRPPIGSAEAAAPAPELPMATSLIIAQKFFDLAGSLEIRDSGGGLVYAARGRWGFLPFFTIVHEEVVVATMRKRWSWGSTFDVEGRLGSFKLVSPAFAFRRFYEVRGGSFHGATGNGNFWQTQFLVQRSDGTPIARASRQMLSIRDKHQIDMVDGGPEAALLVVLICTALLSDRQDEDARARSVRSGTESG